MYLQNRWFQYSMAIPLIDICTLVGRWMPWMHRYTCVSRSQFSIDFINFLKFIINPQKGGQVDVNLMDD